MKMCQLPNMSAGKRMVLQEIQPTRELASIEERMFAKE